MYCKENQIPVVFALKRQLLGKVLLKKVPVSICGIFNYDGAQVRKVKVYKAWLCRLMQITSSVQADRNMELIGEHLAIWEHSRKD